MNQLAQMLQLCVLHFYSFSFYDVHHEGDCSSCKYYIRNLLERGLYRVRTLLAGKMVFRTVQHCKLYFVYLVFIQYMCMFKSTPWLRFYNSVKTSLRFEAELGKHCLCTNYGLVTRRCQV
jgi:hypothetical protein